MFHQFSQFFFAASVFGGVLFFGLGVIDELSRFLKMHFQFHEKEDC